MPDWKRSEIEDAWRHFVAVGDAGDWSAWADLHTEDGVWIEHHLGTFRGRDAIRKANLYNPKEAQQVMKRWLAAGGRLAS